MVRRLVTLLCQLGIVALALFAGDLTQAHVRLIPRWLVRLPGVDYSTSDLWTVCWYFLAIHAAVLAIASLALGPWRAGDARRTVDELFVYGVAFAASALAVFVTTTVAFDPQLMVAIALWVVLLTVAVHLAVRIARAGPAAGIVEFSKALMRRTFSVAGILAIAFAVSPGILAVLFVSNRDVANVITQLRIRFASQADHGFATVNALGTTTFVQPMLVQFPPGSDDVAYVLERPGRLYRTSWTSPGQPELVIDIRDRVGYVEIENGALGFDFHPHFARPGAEGEGLIFLYYTSVIDGEQINRLSRFDLSGATVEERSASEHPLIVWDRNESGFHNGGSVEFGPDGFLYISLGEMSSSASHQRIDAELIAGVLRIDVDRRGAGVSRPIARQPSNGETRDYYIPLDNPFAKDEDVLGEYWALGLRNPFRVSFDPITGNLWAGDVGSTVWEEVNVVRRGRNYQYPFVEGREPQKSERPAAVIGIETGPIYTYRHTAYDRAVIGGMVYRGERLPELAGRYVFGDNYSGKIFAIAASGREVAEATLLGQANQFAQRGITSITQSPDGEILLTTMGKADRATGEVLKLVRSDGTAALPVADRGDDDQMVSAEEASSLYQTNCSRCHGREGKGDGPDAAIMDVPVPDLSSTSFQGSRSDEELYAVIDQGGVPLGMSAMMPPWGALLSEAEMRAIVELLRGFSAHAR